MDDFEEVPGNKPLRLPKKAAKVKNKAPAALQITAEQLLREAKERDLEIVAPPPKTKISDPEELAEYQRKRRKEFEDNIRKNRSQIANWVKYAKWEENIGEMQRARSVNKQINHARNIWDRAITILPRATQFWLKYSYMEELIGNIPGARQVFERWMDWEPPEQAWQTYINFELRYKEIDRARTIWQRFLHVHGHDVKQWLRYAKFEERFGYIGNARAVYERALEYFGEENLNEALLIAFAQFEERQKEHERSRVIFRYGLDHLPPDRAGEIFKFYTIHEKKYGERAGIENVIVSKRRHQYEEQIAENSYNYDAWFDYIRLLQNEKIHREEMEDTFERAIANVPLQPEKRYWRRYIYLWINYALYQELDVGDTEKTRDVYRICLQVIPHKKFTFSKIWVMFAYFEVRQLRLSDARKIMGNAIGMCPRNKLFRNYIDLELQLREFDRCRILYGKFLEYAPENSNTWIKFAEMETLLGDVDRARAIFALAVQQPALDMPEVLWKAYIDFEVSQEEYGRARQLYSSLLERTNHIKVWISLAEFELLVGDVNGARKTYERANRNLASSEKEERLLLLESWMLFETKYGDEDSVTAVSRLMPKKVKRRRQIQTEDGVDAGWEEYFDYVFPDEQTSKGSMKLFEAARRWKEKLTQVALSIEKDADKNVEDSDIKDEPTEREMKVREDDSDTDISTSSSSSSDSDSKSSSESEDSDSDSNSEKS
uniref:Pre-mRNA-splicing factor Syf1/CRNKL1-like C-terminal HAT-repeats domain-containing protein n=1 Tax=Wuchereria bancrofti TaxID=6293 RepID=A0A1I8EGT4_WUCBA